MILEMEIKEYKEYNESELLELYASVGWTAYTNDPVSLKKGYENSLLVLGAYEGDKLVGVLRAVGDDAEICTGISQGMVICEGEHRLRHCSGY